MTDGEPMVVKEVYPKVRGVIVTATGAEIVQSEVLFRGGYSIT